VCPAHKDKAEIKCMGSVGGKHQQNQKSIHSSLTLGTVNKIKLMLWVIRSENEHECNISKHLTDQIVLTYGRIIISMHNMLIFSRL
jgi:hypothetical protein